MLTDQQRERRAAAQKRWKVKNKEHLQAYRIKYQAEHSKEMAEWRRKWRETNYEKDKASRDRYEAKGIRPPQNKTRLKEWYIKNRTAILAQQKLYYEKNKDKAYIKARLRRAKLVSRTIIPFTKKQLDDRLSMFGNRCWMCGAPATEVDHVIALARGGAHALANLRPACLPCNRSKAAKSWR